MKNSELESKLRERNIYNVWNLCSTLAEKGVDDKVITHTAHSSQTMLNFGTYLHDIGKKLKYRSNLRFREAIKELQEKSGIEKWSRTPFSYDSTSYIPSSLLKKAREFVK